MLHKAGVEFVANGVDHGDARIAVVAGDAYLDQFMTIQMDIDFAQHGGRQTRIADNDHGFKMMCPRFEFAAPSRGE